MATVAVALLAAAPGGAATARGTGQSNTIVVGGLLDLSAGWTTLGQSSLVTLRGAAADANAAFRRAGSSSRVVLRIEDAAGTAEGAQEGLRALARAGARLVVGPESSSEAAATIDLAQRLGVLLVSQGSTAGRLAITGDALFRLVPADTVEVRATLALAAADGITAIVPIHRDDIGNQGLVDALTAAGEDFGIVVDQATSYAATDPDLEAAIATLVERVTAATDAAGVGRVGVYLAAFEEAGAVLELAAGDPRLSLVPWYGGDGAAYVPPIVDSPVAAAAATTTGFTAATLGLGPVAAERARRLGNRLGLEAAPDAFALAAYDALRLGVRAIRAVPGGSLAALRVAFRAATRDYRGLSGTIVLNAAGDRTGGPFDLVGVCQDGGPARWGRHVSASAQLAVTLDAQCPAALAQRLIGRWFRALQTEDHEALERLLAPEFQLVRANGTVLDRDEYLANPASISDYDLGPLTTTLDGATLVVTYNVAVDSTLDGVLQPTAPAPRLTVFTRHDGQWLLSAHANFNATS